MSKVPDQPEDWLRECNLTLALGTLLGSVAASFSLFGLISNVIHFRLSAFVEKWLNEYCGSFQPLVEFFRPGQLGDRHPDSAFPINLLNDDIITLLMIFCAIHGRALAVSTFSDRDGDKRTRRASNGLHGYLRFLASEAWLSVSLLVVIGLIAGFALLLPFVGYVFAARPVLTTLRGMRQVAGHTGTTPLPSSFAEDEPQIARRAGYIGWGVLLFMPTFFVINAYAA